MPIFLVQFASSIWAFVCDMLCSVWFGALVICVLKIFVEESRVLRCCLTVFFWLPTVFQEVGRDKLLLVLLSLCFLDLSDLKIRSRTTQNHFKLIYCCSHLWKHHSLPTTWKDLSSSLLFLALRLFWAEEILCGFERCNKDKAFAKSMMTKRVGGYVLNAELSQCTLILDCLMLFGWIKFHFMGIMGFETPLSEGFKTRSFIFSLLYSDQIEPLVAASVPTVLGPAGGAAI